MGESITWLGEKTESTDSNSLCESKHRLNVGIVKIDGKIIPFESYIVVSFAAMDTEGGPIGGAMQAYTHYIETVGGGLADWSRDRGVVYGEGVEGNIAETVKDIGDGIGSGAKKAGRWIGDRTGWWAESNYSSDTEQHSPFYTPKGFEADEHTPWPTWGEFAGVTYQPTNADLHKTMITIENEFEGVKSTVFEGPLAACMIMFDGNECLKCCDMKTYHRYFVTKPGKWTVKATAVGSGVCAKPTYNFEWSLVVPKPDNWDEMVAVNPILTVSQNISTQLQEAGIPFYVSPLAIVGTISLVGGLLIYKIWKKHKG